METYKYLSKLFATNPARTLPSPPPTPESERALSNVGLPPVESDLTQDGTNDGTDARGQVTTVDLTADDDDDDKVPPPPTTTSPSTAEVLDAITGQDDDMDVKTPPQLGDAAGDTLYLSARRRRPPSTSRRRGDGTEDAEGEDDRPEITISHTVPRHLESAVKRELQRRASMGKSRTGAGGVPSAENGAGTGTPPVVQDEEHGAQVWDDKALVRDQEKRGDGMLEEETDEEGERRLAAIKLRHKQALEAETAAVGRRRQPYRLLRAWPVRLSVSIYVFLRRLLSWLGIPYTPRSPHNALLAPLHPNPDPPPYSEVPPTTTMDVDPDSDPVPTSPDELYLSLQKSEAAAQPPTPTRSSFSFLRRVAPSSRTPSPSLLPTHPSTAAVAKKQPPRLTPKTLVLDLDETLIHSTSRPYASSKKNQGLKVRVVEVVLDGRSTVYTVYKRPWVDFFLRKVSERANERKPSGEMWRGEIADDLCVQVSTWYTVIIFTASLPEYADPVIDWLDGGDGGGGMVGGRLFRSVSALFSRSRACYFAL